MKILVKIMSYIINKDGINTNLYRKFLYILIENSGKFFIFFLPEIPRPVYLIPGQKSFRIFPGNIP